MQPENSLIETMFANLIDFKVEKVSALQSDIQILTKLPHGSIITNSKVTIITRTGQLNKNFEAKGVFNGF